MILIHLDDEHVIAKIQAIARRAKAIDDSLDLLDIVLDLAATNEYDAPLDLDKLLKADDFNLMHDIYGISAHLNRQTGTLEDFFVPRCAITH